MIRRVQFCLLVICTEWMGHQEMLEPPESIRDSNSGRHELPGLTSRPIWWALSAHVSAQNTNTHAPHLSLEFHFNFDPHDFFFFVPSQSIPLIPVVLAYLHRVVGCRLLQCHVFEVFIILREVIDFCCLRHKRGTDLNEFSPRDMYMCLYNICTIKFKNQ